MKDPLRFYFVFSRINQRQHNMQRAEEAAKGKGRRGLRSLCCAGWGCKIEEKGAYGPCRPGVGVYAALSLWRRHLLPLCVVGPWELKFKLQLDISSMISSICVSIYLSFRLGN